MHSKYLFFYSTAVHKMSQIHKQTILLSCTVQRYYIHITRKHKVLIVMYCTLPTLYKWHKYYRLTSYVKKVQHIPNLVMTISQDFQGKILIHTFIMRQSLN
jgi:hypothetical protein